MRCAGDGRLHDAGRVAKPPPPLATSQPDPRGVDTSVAWAAHGSPCGEASGFLVGPLVFNTSEGVTSALAGSIPVRLRR